MEAGNGSALVLFCGTRVLLARGGGSWEWKLPSSQKLGSEGVEELSEGLLLDTGLRINDHCRDFVRAGRFGSKDGSFDLFAARMKAPAPFEVSCSCGEDGEWVMEHAWAEISEAAGLVGGDLGELLSGLPGKIASGFWERGEKVSITIPSGGQILQGG